MAIANTFTLVKFMTSRDEILGTPGTSPFPRRTAFTTETCRENDMIVGSSDRDEDGPFALLVNDSRIRLCE